MAKINVVVRIEGGRKQVFLRDVNHDSLPCKIDIVDSADALIHSHPHERNCRSEEEAEKYFNMLKRTTTPGPCANRSYHPHANKSGELPLYAR